MRKPKKITPKKKIFAFVVDGECEKWYLQLLKKTEEKKDINLEPQIPKTKTLEKQFELMKELLEECEKVFWIVDLDVIIKETKKAKKGTENALQKFKKYYEELSKIDKVSIIINNPCLEYWFLLHYKKTDKYFENFNALEPILKKHIIDYEKSEKFYNNSQKNIYQKLKPNLQNAINNSKKLSKFDFDNPNNGIAEMHKIFEELGIIFEELKIQQ